MFCRAVHAGMFLAPSFVPGNAEGSSAIKNGKAKPSKITDGGRETS